MTASCPAPRPPPRQAPARCRPCPLLPGLLWAALALGVLGAADGPPLTNPADHLSDPVTQLVFMAVL